MPETILRLADEMAAAHAVSIVIANTNPEQAEINAKRVTEIREKLIHKIEEVQERMTAAAAIPAEAMSADAPS